MASRPRLIWVPYDKGTYQDAGSAHAPGLIRAAFSRLHSFSVLSNGCLDWTFNQLDSQILHLSAFSRVASMIAIENAINNTLEETCIPLCIGGDHSISLPVIRALSHRYQRDLSIVHVDAHSDTYADIDGFRYHHGAVFRNIVEEGLVEPTRIVQIGIRGQSRDPGFQFVRNHGIQSFDIRSFRRNYRQILVQLKLLENVYVSVDIDAVDPAFAPGTSYPVPGGFSSSEILDLVHDLQGIDVIGADLVEVNPQKDLGGTTVALAAQMLHAMLNSLFSSKDNQLQSSPDEE